MKVTVQEVIDALSDLSLAVLELSMPQDDGFKLDYRTMRTRYKDLAERIRTHGIAPPDGCPKVFVCRDCGGIYLDEPVAQCDCLGSEVYDEGRLVMLTAAKDKP